MRHSTPCVASNWVHFFLRGTRDGPVQLHAESIHQGEDGGSTSSVPSRGEDEIDALPVTAFLIH